MASVQQGPFCVWGQKGDDMPKMVKKGDLPRKICATCGRPFDWRRKWAKVWDEVRYCSERCKREKG